MAGLHNGESFHLSGYGKQKTDLLEGENPPNLLQIETNTLLACGCQVIELQRGPVRLIRLAHCSSSR